MIGYRVADGVVSRGGVLDGARERVASLSAAGAALRATFLSLLNLLGGAAKRPAAAWVSVGAAQDESELLYVSMTGTLRERLSREAARRGMRVTDWAVLKLGFDADRAGGPGDFATVPRWRTQC
jgi:CelD/BcsL family acetyltransferase involved in cellulose biosynthesis